MCYEAARSHDVARVLFVVDRDEAAAHGFDYRRSYADADMSAVRQAIRIEKKPISGGHEPFHAWHRRARS